MANKVSINLTTPGFVKVTNIEERENGRSTTYYIDWIRQKDGKQHTSYNETVVVVLPKSVVDAAVIFNGEAFRVRRALLDEQGRVSFFTDKDDNKNVIFVDDPVEIIRHGCRKSKVFEYAPSLYTG